MPVHLHQFEADALQNPTIRYGRAAIVRDPHGNLVGLMELDGSLHKHYAVGEHAVHLPPHVLQEQVEAQENAQRLFQ